MLTLKPKPLLPQQGGRTQVSTWDVMWLMAAQVSTLQLNAPWGLHQKTMSRFKLRAWGSYSCEETDNTLYTCQQWSSAWRPQSSICPTQRQVPGRSEPRPGPGCAGLPHAKIRHGADPLGAAWLSGHLQCGLNVPVLSLRVQGPMVLRESTSHLYMPVKPILGTQQSEESGP